METRDSRPSLELDSIPKSGHAWSECRADLYAYRTPKTRTAVWQLTNTLLPYGGLWALMILSIRNGYPYAITLGLTFVAALFLVRLFILFHDCVHGSFFPGKAANTFFGRALGVLLFTPFDDWRFSHLRHHVSYANLDTRGYGDIWTMTLDEYAEASKAKRLSYRLYRNPAILFGLGALFTFLLRNRLPTRKTKRRERVSVVSTNLLIVTLVLIGVWTVGWRAYLLVQLPVLWLAGALGIWLFYVQHQFEGSYWARKEEWDALRAAMEGSSYYELPAVLRWFSANIGYHHIHHLNARIPNYRLKACFDAIPELRKTRILTIRTSLSSVRLKLWDEERRRLVGFP